MHTKNAAAMKPQSSLPVVEGDTDAGFTYPIYIVSVICDFLVMISAVAIPFYYMFYDFPPEFSVQLITPNGISPKAQNASISSHAFNVALRANNRRATERCFHHGEALVSYAGYTVASGRTPDFCVPRKQAREVDVDISWDWDGDGVRLPEHLRDRIAAAEKVGAVEIEVQVRLLQGGGRPAWMWCKVAMGTGAQDTPCSVFGLQNWLSDWPSL